VRRAVGADQVDAGDLGLLAAVEREARHGEGLAGGHHHRAVALVEPFRLHADLALLRLAALEPEAEHLEGIGELLRAGAELGVHLVARRGAAEVGQAGAGHPAMRRVVVVDRRQQPAGRSHRLVVDAGGAAPLLGHLGQAAALADGERGELDDAAGAAQRRQRAAVLAGDGDGAAALVGPELDEAHDQIHPPSTT
jgi:hypothetical protein